MDEALTPDEVRMLCAALRKVNFFTGVSMEDIDRIIARFTKARFSRGKKIIAEGKPGTALYVIKSGRCLVYKKKGWFGKERIAELKNGDFFGEMSLLYDTQTSAAVACLEPSELFVYKKNDFLRFLRENKTVEEQIRRIADERKRGS